VVIAAWPFAAAALYLPPLVGSLATGSPRPPFPSLQLQQQLQYYSTGWRRVAGVTSAETFDRMFNNDIYPLDTSIAALLDAHSRGGQPVFIWGGASPWSYALADRLPSSRYVWMGSAYAIDPAAPALAIAEIEARPPATVVVGSPLPATLVEFLRQHGYAMQRDAQNLVFWQR